MLYTSHRNPRALARYKIGSAKWATYFVTVPNLNISFPEGLIEEGRVCC